MNKNKTMPTRAILIFVMIFFLGTVLGLTAYILSFEKTPDVIVQPEPDASVNPNPSDNPEIDISNWKTYSNEEYGFEFKYPEDFKVYDDYPDKSAVFIGTSETNRSPNEGVSMKIIDKEITVAIDEAKNRDEITNVLEEKKDFLNGIEFNKLVLTSAIGYNDAHYFFVKSGKNYEIILDNDNEIQNQILSTFKFTKKDETVDWKTYRNEKYGFQIKYPQDWFVEDSKSATITTTILAIMGTREKPDYMYSHGLFNSETDAFVAVHVSEERLNEPIDRFGGAGTRKEMGVLNNAETMKEYDGDDIIRYVIKNNKIILDFEITFPSNPEKKARAESMVENVLLTFEFIEI